MCGIVGYVGKRNAQDVLLDGLEKLEYRGYDSAGVALALEGGIRVVKSKGRLAELRKRLAVEALARSGCGIGHTLPIFAPLCGWYSPWSAGETSAEIFDDSSPRHPHGCHPCGPALCVS